MMDKSKPSLRELLHEFAEETSAHGAIKISYAKSIFWRLFWILVTLACLGMVIYQGILLLNTFMDKPTKSDIDVTYIRVSSSSFVTQLLWSNCCKFIRIEAFYKNNTIKLL